MQQMVDEAIGILNGSSNAIDDFGRLLHESWIRKRSLSDKISTPFIDEIYEAARKEGAIGGKILGAGGGDSCFSSFRRNIRTGCARASTI